VIDTLEGGFRGPAVDAAILRAFREVVPGRVQVKADYAESGCELREQKWTGEVPGLGVVTVNTDGYVRLGRSLPIIKQMLAGEDPAGWHNNNVLTCDEVNATVAGLLDRAYSKLPWLEPEASPFVPTRADVVYQRPVKSSYATISALKGAVKPTRGGCAWFDNKQGVPTGIRFLGQVVSHRVYDKGLEALAERYQNVVRSEEQLRRGSSGLDRIWLQGETRFSMAECREVLNERYLDVAYGESVDVSELIRQGNDTQALLVMCPEYQSVYKERVKRSGYYAMMRKVREYRAMSVPDDLRVPEEAWQD
jgi:hypothetical protein